MGGKKDEKKTNNRQEKRDFVRKWTNRNLGMEMNVNRKGGREKKRVVYQKRGRGIWREQA